MKKKASFGIPLIIYRELHQIKHNLTILYIAVFLPLALGLILMVSYGPGIAQKLPIAVVNLDNSNLSQQITRAIDATLEVNVKYHVNDLYSAKQLLLSRKAYGILMFPPNFERDVLAARQPEVVAFYDNQLMVAGNTVSKGMANGLAAINAQLSSGLGMRTGTPLILLKSQMNSIPVDQHILFNPTSNYLFSLFSGMWPFIVYIAMILTAALVISLEHKTTANRRIFNRIGGGAICSIFGKLMVYFILFHILLFCIDMLFFLHMGLPFNGHLLIFIPSTSLFIIGTLLSGAIIAHLIPDMNKALSLSGFIGATAFGFIGVAFPRISMGWFSTVWGATLPITSYTEIRFDQTLRGVSFIASLKPVLHLLILDCILAGVLILLIKKQNSNRYFKEQYSQQNKVSQ